MLRFMGSHLTTVETLYSAAAAAAKSLQSCPTLCNPINGSPPGSPIPGILLARTLEWVAISFSRRSSRPRDLTRITVSLQSSNRRVRPRLVWRNGTLLASPVVHGVTGHFSSCVWREPPDEAGLMRKFEK